MFVAIYSFKIIAEKRAEFLQGWEDLTRMIYENEGSLGSRIHKKNDSEYIAYAQWPDKTTFDNAGGNMPKEADSARKMMKDACSDISTIHELEMVSDLLKDKHFIS